MSTRELLAWVEMYGVSESTARVTLTRMVAADDVTRDGGLITLTDRHSERQAHQTGSLMPREKPWGRDWSIVVVTVVGLPPPERAAIRQCFTHLRMAEVRDGVWARPDNLVPASGPGFPDRALHVVGPVSRSSAELVADLWDLSDWATRGAELASSLASALNPVTRLTIGAALVRHLRLDPVLPSELQPAGWPSTELRQVYADYRRQQVPHI